MSALAGRPLLAAAYRVAHGYPGGAQQLDVRLGLPMGTLSAQVAGRGSSKLGLETALQISALAHDADVLTVFAAELGYMVIPMPGAANGQLVDDLLAGVARSGGDFAELVREVLADSVHDNLSDNDLRRIEADAGRVMADIQAILAAARAKNAAGKQGRATV